MDYSLSIDFNKYKIGREYKRNNRKCIFDSIREILIIVTPEEIVRQKFVAFLIEKLEIPKSKIQLEVPMAHFKKGAKGRADIIVYGENNEGNNVPIILIECKAPNVPLVDEVWFQAYKYDDVLGVGFIIITNGDCSYGAIWDENDEEYHFIEELPKYKQLINSRDFKFIYDDSDGWKRPNFNELTSKNNIEHFWDLGWIGESTDENLYPLIINLAGFLQDTSENFSPINMEGVKIIEDGHRYTTFGNAGGGTWAGDYKYFIVQDSNGNNQVVSVSILGSLKCTDHPKFGNRKGHTTLVVAIDDFDKRHNSLQLNIDKYTKIQGSNYTIWHDGTITIGKNGAGKKQQVVDFIKNHEPSMVGQDQKIILGNFDCSKEIRWEQNSTKKFIRNIIRYAILRDEFRSIKQNN